MTAITTVADEFSIADEINVPASAIALEASELITVAGTPEVDNDPPPD